MSEYINRTQALSDLRSGFFPQDVEHTEAVSIAKRIIEGLPVVDVVEVVRCKECRWFRREENTSSSFDGSCDARYCETNGDDYCSYGERRDVSE